MDKFSEESIDKLMTYITVNEDVITFDYEESAACCDLKVVAFKIPCQFDEDKYLKDIA